MPQIYKNSDGNYYKLPENHPVVSLIYLLLLVFVNVIVFFILSMGVGLAMYGPGLFSDIPAIISGLQPDKLDFIKIFQMLSTVGSFIVPCLFLQLIEKRRTQYFLLGRPLKKIMLPLAALIMLTSMPLLELSILLNEKMQLPEFLSGLEAWMLAKEQEMERLTNLLISSTDYPGLLINLFMIAVLPAIGEELIFRGALQNIFSRWTGSPQAAIWIVAVLFSAIHLQFYGFLPRMLMGALFGYLYFWGKSLWLPILAHFLNNAYATVMTFVLLRQGNSMEQINQQDASSTWIYIFSFVGTAVLIRYFWQLYQNEQNRSKA